ncbi:hypothetical protein GOBAR_DD34550 [Gossypium barbadense]|nr:hypothetical protein GOBAR_DD34550 [Gossypium barbadense]
MRRDKDFDFTWGGKRGKVFNGGKLFSMSQDRVLGSGFQSKKECLFGRIAMQLKLGASTITALLIRFSIGIIMPTTAKNEKQLELHQKKHPPVNVFFVKQMMGERTSLCEAFAHKEWRMVAQDEYDA